MTIANSTQYTQKKAEFDTKYAIFLAEFDRMKSQPCGNYNSTSTNLNIQCLDEVWKQSGCDKQSPYTVVNRSNKTLYDTINDAYKWSSLSNPRTHPKSGCYANLNAPADMTKNYNINGVTMKTMNASKFAKDGTGIGVNSLDNCKENCLPETGCISATYNSSTKKCWTNFGSLSDWKEPETSTDPNDVAIYYELIQLLNQLDVLNNDLYNYEVANPATATDSGAGSVSVSGPGSGSESSQTGILDSVLQSMSSSLLGSSNNPPPPSVDTKDFAALKQKVTVIDTDRIATAKTLEEYKKQLIEMSQKQEDSNAKLKKDLITIALIAVIGILLIFLLSAAVQSMNSGSNNFSGGGLKKCSSILPLKNLFTKLFRKK
jgi:hypothetical protein